MQIDRNEFIDQILEERRLRSYIRKTIGLVTERKEARLRNERKLRSMIQTLARTAINEVKTKNLPVHDSTGMNRLEDLFSNTSFLDAIQKGYKQLTTDVSQRKSFRSHLLSAINNLLKISDLNNNADDESTGGSLPVTPGGPALALAEQTLSEDGLDISFEEEEALNNLNISDEEKQEKDFTIPGLDETGRNIALQTYNNVEDLILNSLKPIVNPEDSDLFSNYLEKNLNLYFKQFEKETSKDNG